MNKAQDWFNLTHPMHVLSFLALLLAINAAMWVAIWPDEPEVISSRKPLIIIDIEPHADKVAVGEPFPVTFEFEKTREDCENGRITRHMWEIQHGWTYLIESAPTVQAPAGLGKFRAEIPTEPLDPRKRELMLPGLWRIDSLLSYECPTQDGGTAVRQEAFSTPIFKVIETKKKGGR